MHALLLLCVRCVIREQPRAGHHAKVDGDQLHEAYQIENQAVEEQLREPSDSRARLVKVRIRGVRVKVTALALASA